MSQKYKVFLNERSILLTDKWPNKLLLKDSILAIKVNKKSEIKSSFDLFSQNKSIQNLILVSNDLETSWNQFNSLFTEVPAAGGLVFNENNQCLMIFRRGFWDLPKGKLDKGESLKDCAVREVEEECGLKSIKREHKICVTYHIYGSEKAPNIKPSHWYLMTVKGAPKLKPQKEEDIEKAIWVSPKNAKSLLKKAYPSIKEVFKAYKKSIRK